MSEPTGKLKFAYETIATLEQQLKERDALLDECEATIDQLLTVYVPYNDISQKGGKELITKIQNRNKP